VRVDVLGAAEHVHDVDLTGHVGNSLVSLLPQDRLGLRVVDGHGHDFEAHRVERLRHVEGGPRRVRFGAHAQHGDAARAAEQLGQALRIFDQVVAPVLCVACRPGRRAHRSFTSLVGSCLARGRRSLKVVGLAPVAGRLRRGG
jgi:hypothetical protein